jgi:hypothetical protein
MVRRFWWRVNRAAAGGERAGHEKAPMHTLDPPARRRSREPCMPPFPAPSIKLNYSDALSASVAVFRFQPGQVAKLPTAWPSVRALQFVLYQHVQ